MSRCQILEHTTNWLRTLTSVLLAVTVLSTGLSATTKYVSKTTRPIELRFPTDTLWLIAGGVRQSAYLGDFHDPDTSLLRATDTMTFLGATDTIIVTVEEEPVVLLLLSPKFSIREYLVLKTEPVDTGKFNLLRKYARFGTTTVRSFPGFQYADSSASSLRAFRQSYSLDSIAGGGDDISRIVRLMHWFHRVVRWDGSKNNPDAPSSLRMIDLCIKGGQTANCGGLAGMLTTVYAAMGIKSRQLVCRPYDKADQDCHSVNMVFAPQKQKWVLIDPTNDAYFRNLNGDYLSPQQIRLAMVQGDSLVVPDSINVNGNRDSRTWYLNYMAKNLFRFSCWEWMKSSDTTHPETLCQLSLNPTGYDAELVGTVDSTSDASFVGMYTDDESLFWAKP